MPDPLQTEANKVNAGKEQTEPVKDDSILSKVTAELDKLRETNDALEREKLRAEELRAQAQLGGKAAAGQPTQKTQQELYDEEAAAIIKNLRSF